MSENEKNNGKKNEPNPEFQNFQRLLENTLAVPKDELDKRRDEYERAKDRRKHNRQ